MARITKEMIIADILQVDVGLALVLRNHGMHCVGCPSARGETLEQAAVVHGMDADELVEELNAYLKEHGTAGE